MKISLSKLLMIFFVGLSALPVIAMAALILIMNSDIRAIAENEFCLLYTSDAADE